MPSNPPIQVSAQRRTIAVGVIMDRARERVLLTRRPGHVEHGGLWEFPGGKVEPGESVRAALTRELREELGIDVTGARPFLRISHDYPGRPVELDVWLVGQWRGDPHGLEGQQQEWVDLRELHGRRFPEANTAIVNALQMPELLLITPDLEHYDQRFLDTAHKVMGAGIRFLVFRSTRAGSEARLQALIRLAAVCHHHGAAFVVNGTLEEMRASGADGLHLPARALLQSSARPGRRPCIVGASCHNLEELRHAATLGLDYALLGPVMPTSSHPQVIPLGWERTSALLSGGWPMPVYVLGGLGPGHLSVANDAGARGVAMISAVWSSADPGRAAQIGSSTAQ